MRRVTIRRRPASEVGGQTRIRTAGLSATPTPSGSSRPRQAEQRSAFRRICHSQLQPPPPGPRWTLYFEVHVQPATHRRRCSCSRRLFLFLSPLFPQNKNAKKTTLQSIYDFNQSAKHSVYRLFFHVAEHCRRWLAGEKQMKSRDNKEFRY